MDKERKTEQNKADRACITFFKPEQLKNYRLLRIKAAELGETVPELANKAIYEWLSKQVK